MTTLFKWVIAFALGVAVSGQLKSATATATLEMAQMAAEVQLHQMSFGKFSRMLTTQPQPTLSSENEPQI